MRVFLAVHPGEQLVTDLTTALDGWRDRIPVRWTRPQNWHLTLQFLGDWPEDHLTALKSTLKITADTPAFVIEPGPVGGFPNLKDPRVLFLHLDGDGQVAALAESVRAIVQRVWPDGPQDRKAFCGHLTLARIRRRLRPSDLNILQKMELSKLASVPASGFFLISSELNPSGPVYRELAFFPLKQA